MVNYTFDDFLSAATKSGTLNQFSQYDLALAQKYPEFGLSLVTLKQDYAKAATPEARSLANTAAENLRKNYGNYTAGASGSGYYSEGPAPTNYNSAYGQQINQLLGNVTNRQQFSYNPETDPDYSAYRKQYLREGQRATADTLGQASAATGGIPSTAAVTAATQAGDYYAGQLADKVPELSRQAYSRYLNNYNLDISALGALQNQDQTDYARLLDQVNYNSGIAAQGQEQNLAQKNEAKSMVDAILAAGGRPPADIVAASGYPQEYIDTMAAYYTAQARKGTGTGVSTNAKEAKSIVDDILKAGGIPSAELVAASGYPQEYVDAMVKYYAKSPVERFQSGDFSDEVIEGLLNSGWTKSQIVESGYMGDYFKKNLPPETPTQSKTGNYQTVNETLAGMKAAGASTSQILAALKEVKGELSQTDYISLYNKYRG